MIWSTYTLSQIFGTGCSQSMSTVIIPKSALTPYGLSDSTTNKVEQIIAALAIRAVAVAPSSNAAYLLQCQRWGQTYPVDLMGKRWSSDIILIQFNYTPIKESNTLFNPNDF